MVRIVPSKKFLKDIRSIDSSKKEKIAKQIKKIIKNPCVGKPLKYSRGERALYIKPFRLVYATRKDELILLKFEHRKSVYR